MKRLTLFGTVMMAILALTAVIASTASAKPEFLDHVTGNTFEGKGGAGTLSTLKSILKIACKANTVKGEVTGPEEGIIKELDFTGCSAFGLTASSLGDAAGTILTAKNLPFKLCYIGAEANKEVGIIIEKIPTVHIDVLGGSLSNVEGSIIGKITPINTLTTTYTLTFESDGKGDQKPVTCKLLGKTLNASLTSSEDTKHEKPESAAIGQKDEIIFNEDIEIMA